jgi:hypothetical protein
MRRSSLIGLAAAGLLLLAAGGYTAFWFVAAARVEDGIGQLVAALRPHKVDLSWQSLRVSGFPLALRVALAGVELRDRAPVAASVTRLVRLKASAAPWNFRAWQLAAPDGLQITAGSGLMGLGTISAAAASGTLLVPAAGGVRAWFDLRQPHAGAGVTLAAQQARVWLILPAHPPKTDEEPAFGLAVDARNLMLPPLPPPFRNPLDELAFGITVRGAVPTTPPREAATTWRNAGGTADVDHVALRSGALAIVGSGTIALDGDLQPEGAFSLAVEDYPALLDVLVAEGRLRRTAAKIARLALTLMAKPGPDGKPEVRTALRMQRGEMFLGPVAIGPAPHIDW